MLNRNLKVFTVVVLLGIMLMLTGCESAPTQKVASKSQSPTEQKSQPFTQTLKQSAALPNDAEVAKMVTQRKAIIQEWIAQADAIAQKTKNPQAIKIVDLLKTNGVMCRPNENGIQFLEGATPGKTWVGFVPIMKNEVMPNQKWKDMAESNDGAGAHYIADANTIVLLDSTPTSPIFKGIILLHEGNHAAIALFNPYDQSDLRLFCYDERDTHEFQNSLMAAVGGKVYQDMLNKEIQRMKDIDDKNGIRHADAFTGRGPYNPELDKIFGPAQSQVERDLRQTHIWIHAVFTMIDMYGSGDKEDNKARFLRTMYHRQGMM